MKKIFLAFFINLAIAGAVHADMFCGLEFNSVDELRVRMNDTMSYNKTSETPKYITFDDRTGLKTWTFTKPGHPAHPSALCRTFVKKDDKVDIKMEARCGSKKAACDAMIAEFRKLNKELVEKMRKLPTQ